MALWGNEPEDDELEDDDVDLDDFENDDLDDEDVDDEDDEFLTPERSVEILARAAGTSATWMRGDRILMPTEMRCQRCGCTDRRACPGGCFWVAPNLCSECAL